MSEEVVGEGVDVEGEFYVLFGRIQDGFPTSRSSVIDEDCRVSESCLDFCSCAGDRRSGREVDVEVSYRGRS